MGWLRRVTSSLRGSSLGHDVDLQQTGHCVHSVEDPKGQANVHDGRPHGITIEVQFRVIVKLGPGTKRWHDPELCEEMGEQHRSEKDVWYSKHLQSQLLRDGKRGAF